MFFSVGVFVTIICSVIGCSGHPSVINTEHTPSVLATEANDLDAHSQGLRDTLDRCWFVSSFCYLELAVDEDEYNSFYCTKLNEAELEYGELNRCILPSYRGDYSRIREAREHLTKLEDILDEVEQRLASVDANAEAGNNKQEPMQKPFHPAISKILPQYTPDKQEHSNRRP